MLAYLVITIIVNVITAKSHLHLEYDQIPIILVYVHSLKRFQKREFQTDAREIHINIWFF